MCVWVLFKFHSGFQDGKMNGRTGFLWCLCCHSHCGVWGFFKEGTVSNYPLGSCLLSTMDMVPRALCSPCRCRIKSFSYVSG